MSDSESEAGEIDLRELYRDPIISRISAVGGVEAIKLQDGSISQEYKLGDECLGCLKDLKKFWRKDDDDPNRTVARILHESGVFTNDLLKILALSVSRGNSGDRIALAATDLISCLTWPISIEEEFKELVDREEEHKVINFEYTSFIQAQQAYKLAIVKSKTVQHLLELLLPRLAKSRLERTERDDQVVALILHTFRNILAIKDTDAHPGVQSELIDQMHSFEILSLFNTLASSSDQRELIAYNVVVLEIFHFLFRGIRADELTLDPVKASSAGLSNLLDIENKQKRLNNRSNTSRHSRFGTTVSVLSGDNRFVQSRQSAITPSGGEQSMDIGKKKVFKRSKDQDNSGETLLNASARKHLKELAELFLKTSYDTFFTTLLKDFRMERPKVRETDKARWFSLSAFFLEYFNTKWRSTDASKLPAVEAENTFGYVGCMIDPTTVGYVSARMAITIDDKPPSWKELHCAINCLIQILSLVDEMISCTQAPAVVEVAEVLQDKLYYSGDVMDVIVMLMGRYKDQSVQFLESIVHLAYVFLRMLENFSKSKAYMFVRKRKSSKRRNGDINEPTMQTTAEDDAEANRETLSAAEHKFVFSSYERRFASENIVKTCLTYLERHLEFHSTSQLKHVVNLLYRQAVRAQGEELFYKVSTLNIFRNVQDQVVKSAVNYHSGPYKDLMKLIEFILRKFFKSAAENPMIFVEALFPMRSHSRKNAAIEAEDVKETGLSDDNENRPKSDADFPDGAHVSEHKKKRPRAHRRRRDDEEQREVTVRQEQAQSYLSAKFIEDSDEDEESLQDFYRKEESLRAHAKNAAATAEVPQDSLSLVAKRRKAKEAEQVEPSQGPVIQNSVDDNLQSQELFSQSVMDVAGDEDEDDTSTQAKSLSKRRRVIDSDDE
ncbi:hypothetical protein E3P92_01291 [Wallemia ichthyophaga]|uniref:Topoisomerase 1-associated factor 1 n=1 Tax=Wallemia ichthyophaga (strain EXF-994 / CBS 113033) TaxID=1299270 RepID=R9ABQ5_WALI9|nr:Topoisomerase 1-associated factor 1 [Wallemia ichthyophaga EXF-994]TIB01757.1 hypothetical protein E3P95_01142 [Wallemia ichthyophaga]EOQ99643.1 Topoisomerase 1-associated factor 1 [Wallemia ichthyophaga EXF-994]TIB02723.1 hypothetical protein E3P94_01274 [Wallemia ichthyophaga]TIB16472.1 hypothetical protein E3P92_01291 [Wallemia ichthyophaga]TIB33356.1 hypothetical protein E3P84_02169 [Wallemia ichthyophaga]